MLYDHLVEGNLIIECNTDNCQLHELLPSICPVKDKYLRILNFLVERNIKEKWKSLNWVDWWAFSISRSSEKKSGASSESLDNFKGKSSESHN